MTIHTHTLLLIGELAGDQGGAYPLRWCRDCGTLIYFMGDRHEYEQPPNMARSFAINAPYRFVHEKHRRTKSRTVLGRGLLDLQNAPQLKVLPGDPDGRL